MIYKIVYGLRVIAVCLIILFVLAYLFNWSINREITIGVIFSFLLVYIVASWVMIFTRFRQMNRRPPTTNQVEDDKKQ